MKSILVSILFITGCVSFDKPKDNSPLTSNVNLEKLAGLYENIGDDGTKSKVYLSKYIWQKMESYNHRKIHYIEVKAISKTTLEVIAKSKDKQKVIRSNNFELGRDFVIEKGCIKLKEEMEFTAPVRPGMVFLGAYYNKECLGLSEDGHGKYKSKEGFFGTAFIIFPIVGAGSKEVRFKKLN